MLDVLIRNGLVVDGTGKPGIKADVGIEKDRISLVGHANGFTAAREIDASGKVVCPGIVDPHSHADLTIFRPDHAQLLEPLVRQGVTTFIGGNCGLSMAPLGVKHRAALQQYIEVFTNLDLDRECPWQSMGEFLDTLEKRGVLLNTGVLAPHGVIRINQLGPERRYATDAECDAMADEVERAVDEGALGLSAGLQYYPGSQSDTREMVRLGRALKRHNGVFACHLRSYSANTVAKAIDEVVEVARTNGIAAQISHIFALPVFGPFGPPIRAGIRALAKLSDRWTPPLPLDGPLRHCVDRMLRAIESGADIGMDVMPTTTGFTHLLAFFPPWALEGSREDVIARLRDPESRKRIRRAIEHGKGKWPHVENDSWSLNLFHLMGWECCRIMAVVSEKNKRYEGMRLVDIAREQHKHPLDAACDLLLEEEGHVLVFESLAHPEDKLTERSTFAPIKHPKVSISTDTILMGMGKPSMLFYGCYPKFFGRYVREKRMLPIETAVHKVTGLPAAHFRLKGRGLLAEGAFADVLVFDPERIATNATFDKPDCPPAGIEHVFINGKHVIEGDTFHADLRAGAVLRRA
ncbi:MAG TPA: amidohydrolase family protein [Candidatus Hydrogenedentes bacterium]|nr:amidohydrolase family protein [Candidatus Hydrogenedentota bacterium]HRT22205.1 amidohydrolase family protein [Candidatus Hydrogenedentota bacterium]HRT65350.1 amidohydrolase family protein [Candidatus Hydrogenedentota bacterium]